MTRSKGVIVFASVLFFLHCYYAVNGRVLCPAPDSLFMPLLDTSIVKLNLSRVPTAILEDFGETIVRLDAYSGTSAPNDTNRVNFRTLNGILSSLSTSRTGSSPLQIPKDITGMMSARYSGASNPVGIVAYKYNRTKEFAVANHLLRVEDGKYYDKFDEGGNWVDPYEEEYVVAFSPYMNVCGGDVTYTFSSDQLFTNLPISSIRFNAGDGQGYRNIGTGSTSVTVSYPLQVLGVILTLEVTLVSGMVLLAHSLMNLIFPPAAPAGGSLADSTFTVTCNSTYLGYQETAGALVSVKYANGTNLTKPLIVAEGFDPLSNPDAGDGTSRGFNYLDSLSTSVRMLGLGYDIVYIDWLNSRAPIQANADILRQVIEWVNAHKNTACAKSVLVGQSMGGLVSRYALRTMELADTPHDVGVYVSDDSPHFGASVPIGYLYAIQKILGELSFVDSMFVSDLMTLLVSLISHGTVNHASTYIHEVFSLVDAPSVRQMLMHYVSPELEYDNSLYDSFQQELNSLGFPQGDAGSPIINLTISNGGVNNFSNNLTHHLHFDGGAYAGLLAPALGILASIGFETVIPAIIGSLALFNGPRFQIDVYPNYYGTQQVYSSSKSWKAYRGLLKGTEVVTASDSFYAPQNSRVYDSDYGSYYDLRASADTTYSGGNLFVGGYSVEVALNNRFMFVPTFSSLAYRHQSGNVFPSDRVTDFATLGMDMSRIPFQGYKFVENGSTYHTTLNNGDIEWIDRMTQLSITQPPQVFLPGYQFTITDTNPSGGSYTVTWSVDDTSVANVDPVTGAISFSVGGVTHINADITFNDGHYRLRRQISVPEISFPGFPSYILSAEADRIVPGSAFSGNYSIWAMPSSSIDPVFKPFMMCHWGLKTNINSPIQWTTQPYNSPYNPLSYFCTIPNTATFRMVYFYVSYQNLVSPTYSVVCNVPPSMYILDGEGNLYTEDLDEPFAQVKGEITDEMYYFTCTGSTLVYDHWPTWAEFGSDMLENEEFVELLKTLRPWGAEELVLIPYSYHSDNEPEEEYGVITVIFDETL
ncbi:MAG: hypothetical protein IKR38_00580 [Bacteroidales bacterium]|nr:hypothetical protein [Bacteroidales bacterium]